MKKAITAVFFVLFSLLFFSCGAKSSASYYPTEGWKTSSPEAQGVSSSDMAAAIEKLTKHSSVNIHGMVFIRHGNIIAEYYSSPYDADTRHNLHSATKSFTSTLIGMAVKKRLLKINEKVLSFFPGKEVENINSFKEAMTVEHLLTQTSGMDWPEQASVYDPDNPFWLMMKQDNWGDFILNRKVFFPPGTDFNYNTGNSHLLNIILFRVLKSSVAEFASKELFGPLGITNYQWKEDPQGVPIGGVNLFMTPRDMAKLGYLYLHQGVWEGKQILAENWVEQTRTDYLSGERQAGYGYQWWTGPYMYAASGYGGQCISVLPEWDAVFVITGCSNTVTYDWNSAIEEFWNNMSKSIKNWDGTSLPEDPAGEQKLHETLNKLSTEIENEKELPSFIRSAEGHTIIFDNNPSLVHSITIDSINSSVMNCTVSYRQPDEDGIIEAHYQIGLNNRFYIQPYSAMGFVPFEGSNIVMSCYSDYSNFNYGNKSFVLDDNSLGIQIHMIGSTIYGYYNISFDDKGYLLFSSIDGKEYKARGELIE